MTVSRDLVIGIAVVAAMSVAYLQTGEYPLRTSRFLLGTDIVPVVTCVTRDPVNAGSFIASFGYERSGGGSAVDAPYAAAGLDLNYVEVNGQPVPATVDYGVPTRFEVGRHPSAFSIRALDGQKVTWWLTSSLVRSASATRDSVPACAPGQIR